MDIEKEKIAHEKHLLSQGVDFKYLPNIQYNELENIYELIEWDEEYSEALNEINSSWCTWQAAKAQAVSEGRTDFEIINSMKEVDVGIAIDLTNTERRISTAEFALRMNISKKELYARINDGRIQSPKKDGRKNYWLNSYVLECIVKPDDDKISL